MGDVFRLRRLAPSGLRCRYERGNGPMVRECERDHVHGPTCGASGVLSQQPHHPQDKIVKFTISCHVLLAPV